MKTLLSLLLTSGCFAQTITLSLANKNWIESAYNCYDSGNICNSIRVPLSNDSSGDLNFTFPASPANPATATSWNEFSYLQSRYTKPLTGEHFISVTLQTMFTPGTQFEYTWGGDGNTCIFPAHARVLIEQQRDNGGQYMRWWSNPIAYDLTVGGMATITTALTPDQWSSVYGQFGNANPQATKGFNTALAKVGLLGLTFGGGCFFGHGVDVLGGTAQFSLISFQIY